MGLTHRPLNGHGESIVLPSVISEVDFEAELVIVNFIVTSEHRIARLCRSIDAMRGNCGANLWRHHARYAQRAPHAPVQASLCMLSLAVDRCPDASWNECVASWKFCQSAFHVVFFADVYLQPDDDVVR